MKKYIATICMLFVSSAVHAAEPPVPAKECQYLTAAYQPSGDAEYKPGVDVHGKPVASADISAQLIKPPDKYSFDISIDTAKYIGLHVPAGVMGEAKIGAITVENGQASFNGKPLAPDAEAALKALCSPKKPEKTPK